MHEPQGSSAPLDALGRNVVRGAATPKFRVQRSSYSAAGCAAQQVDLLSFASALWRCHEFKTAQGRALLRFLSGSQETGEVRAEARR